MADTSSISLTVSEPQRAALLKAFGPFRNRKEEQDAMQQFANFCVCALFDWLTGAKRYRSLTEQYIDWIEQIYGSLIPRTEAPSADRIYNSLNVPHGQATYIARILASKTLTYWREVATKELRDALDDIAKEARQYIKDGDEAQAINVQISQVAVHELLHVCSVRRRLSRSYLMPQLAGSAGDFRFVSIPASTVANLLDDLKW